MLNDQASAQQSGRFPRSFHLVAKPIGFLCNLDCTYCYYLHKEGLLPGHAPGRMNEALLEEFIRQYVAGQEIDEVVFNWHGGEPTLAGLDFYRKVVELQARYAGAKRVRNDFQTNGVLLDESWCEFFKRHGFYVGLSIDGPKHLHDRFRVAKGGTPTFDLAYRAARLLRPCEVPFNPLTVISAANARHPEEVYRFVKSPEGQAGHNYLCPGPRRFFAYADPYLRQIADQVRRKRFEQPRRQA